MKKIIAFVGAGVVSLVGATASFAVFTLPELPTANLETAGTAVAALIAVAVVIGVVFRLLKKA